MLISQICLVRSVFLVQHLRCTFLELVAACLHLSLLASRTSRQLEPVTGALNPQVFDGRVTSHSYCLSSSPVHQNHLPFQFIRRQGSGSCRDSDSTCPCYNFNGGLAGSEPDERMSRLQCLSRQESRQSRGFCRPISYVYRSLESTYVSGDRR